MTPYANLHEQSGAAERRRWQGGRSGESELRSEDTDFMNLYVPPGCDGVNSGADPGATGAVKWQHGAAGANSFVRVRTRINLHSYTSNIQPPGTSATAAIARGLCCERGLFPATL